MPQQSDLTSSETMPSPTRVYILGAGPVGLLLTALLQPEERFSLHLYEKRRDYTRTRMVQLAPYLVADSVASYCTDLIDEESIQAIFTSDEINEGLAFRQSIPPDLMTLLRGRAQGFCPLNTIERSLSDQIDARHWASCGWVFGAPAAASPGDSAAGSAVVAATAGSPGPAATTRCTPATCS